MAGIYIHIPFCKKACHYCNFHFSTSLNLKNDFLQALLNETGLRTGYLNDEAVSTIYFGGGTPSLLNQQETKNILDKIRAVDVPAEGVRTTLPDLIDFKPVSVEYVPPPPKAKPAPIPAPPK